MTFKELRQQSGMNMTQFAEYFGIPYRTIQNWERGERKCPQYLLDLMEYKLDHEKHGQWKYDLKDGKPYKDEDYGYIYSCSLCGCICIENINNYCPNCGAKMDE